MFRVRPILIFFCVLMILASGGYIYRTFNNTIPGRNPEEKAYRQSTGCGFDDATDSTNPCTGTPATITAKRASSWTGTHSGTQHWEYFVTVRKSSGESREVGIVREEDYSSLREGTPVTAVMWKNYLVGINYNGGNISTDDAPGLTQLKGIPFKAACGVFAAGLFGLQLLSNRRRRRFGIL